MPLQIRNVAVVGHLHSGKTALVDLLLRLPHGTRYTDTRLDEQQRGVSVRTALATTVNEARSATCVFCFLFSPPPFPRLFFARADTAQDARGKSWSLSLLDAPGHPQCHDGVLGAMRAADGVLLCVDAVEGLLQPAVRTLQSAARQRLRVVLVLCKLDRLVLELRLPPADAYHKLRHIIDHCNTIIRDSFVAVSASAADSADAMLLSPARANVLFASALHGYAFTPESFAAALYPHAGATFAQRLWGDIWFDAGPQKTAFSDMFFLF